MTEFQVVVKGRVCSVYHNCVNALAEAKRIAADGRPAAVLMFVVRGSYQSRTAVWPQVGPTASNRRYRLSCLRA